MPQACRRWSEVTPDGDAGNRPVTMVTGLKRAPCAIDEGVD